MPISSADVTDGFVSESAIVRAGASARNTLLVWWNGRLRTPVKWSAVVVLSILGAIAGAWLYQQRLAPPLAASLTLNTNPPGVEVAIAGRAAGRTPVAVSLPAGEYPVVLTAPDGQRRDLQVTLAAGGSVVQHIEMGLRPTAVAPSTGALRVETEPSGQAIFVDGVRRGGSPLTIESLTPGEHVVLVRGPRGTVRRTVAVRGGETVSLVLAPVQQAAVSAGWVAFQSPVPLQVREGGKVIGTTESERLMLPAGQHDVELVNDALGFRLTRRFSVSPDATTTVRIEVPNGTLSINALPWAEVWVDGERIGETPIANLSRPIGTHQVILRHPQLGEREVTLTVPAAQPARLGVDMRRP